MNIEVKTSEKLEESRFWYRRPYKQASEIWQAWLNMPENSWIEVSGFDEEHNTAFRIREMLVSTGAASILLTGSRIRTKLMGTNGDLRLLIGKEKIG